MTEERPNPDRILAQLRSETPEHKAAQLKIFFGYAAGVGKTYAMLENAHRALATGKDVVIGYLEPHARPATQQLAERLESLPVRQLDYRGVKLNEFDVDAALARRPEIILVDELAHTNVEGSRHSKRWQDIEELLEAGIDVWTTLNVQHIESLNDIVGQVTGIVVRETIPDQVFESADEIELVDLPPDDLLERLDKGQVYVPEQAKRALESFFKRANLNALREMSLRQVASRVHSEVESARLNQTVSQPWATAERLLVCVGPSPTTARVIRTAKRMATALDAQWMAVSVDLPGVSSNGPNAASIAQHFRLAERLGAEVLTLAGDSVVETILDYARNRNITKIFIGKTSESKWKRWISRSLVDQLIEASGEIDVYVIQGKTEKAEQHEAYTNRRRVDWRGHMAAIGVTAIVALLSYALGFFRISNAEANRVMLFLAGVTWVAFRSGAGPAVTASILSVLVFDFVFVPPYLTFAVSDAQYIVTFAVMLTIGLLVSKLASRLKVQVENSRRREYRSNSLYELGKELSSLYGQVFLVSAASRKLSELLMADVVVYLRDSGSRTYPVNLVESDLVRHATSLPAADWVIEHGQIAGVGTNTLPNACALFVPLQGSQSCLGALAVKPFDNNASRLLQPDTRRVLDSGANQLALALERDRLAIEAAESRLEAEAEQLRTTLLSSVSHDLKTPLASIAGASSTLIESPSISAETRNELLFTIASETQRLNRVLDNVLQMSRLDADAANPNLQWHVLEEIVGSALKRMSKELQSHPVTVELPTSLPLIFVDDVLLEQVFINLLDNATKYTPVGTGIAIAASVQAGAMCIRVRDRGPGIPVGLEEKIFDKFHRANTTPDAGKGNGLGLAICRAVVKLLGGSISASNPQGGGAEFTIQLPLTKQPPSVQYDGGTAELS